MSPLGYTVLWAALIGAGLLVGNALWKHFGRWPDPQDWKSPYGAVPRKD